MISNLCPKCGKALCVCLFLGLPVFEAVNSPAEEHCATAQSCTQRLLATEPWSPDAPEHGSGTTQATIEKVAETAGAAIVPWGWSDAANALPVGHRYRRSAALAQSGDGAWMGPLALRLIRAA
jgi:hypothetical protein